MSREKKETQKQRGRVELLLCREAWKSNREHEGWRGSDGGKEIRERVSRNINFEKLFFSSSVRISPCV